MTNDEIHLLIGDKAFPACGSPPRLKETHISWVILCDKYVYKIKKPIHYSFLDFSSVEKRLFYCREEIRLNWRLTFNVYIDLLEIRKTANRIVVGGTEGEVIDYALRMRRLESARQMDLLLQNDLVSEAALRDLAIKIASFHQKAAVVRKKDVMEISNLFNDLTEEADYLNLHLGKWAGNTVSKAILHSNQFLSKNKKFLQSRLKEGYYRDVHGDLHSKNVFLLTEPVIFDCLEFNADYRQIDLLNEIAFLCMDLDSFGRKDLSALFLTHYADFLSLSLSQQEMQLFTYYKAYRANVRAKVNSLRARSAATKADSTTALKEAEKYLHLMSHYFSSL